jgi:Zn-dependent M28 family amino/carboxypeptidase
MIRPVLSKATVTAVTFVVTAALVLAGCSSSEKPATAENFGRDLAGKITVDGMFAHLRKLQEIADANDGTRAEGTPGFDASLDYVAQVLRDKGFDVQTPEFDRLGPIRQTGSFLNVSGRSFRVDQVSLLSTTPKGGVEATTLRPRKAPGCRASDYDGVTVRGAIAVVTDTGCSVVDKDRVAAAEGAVGVLVVSAPQAGGSPTGLFTPGYYRGLTLPVAVIGTDADAALRRTSAPIRLTLPDKATMVTSRNLLAQTKNGDTENVVMAGAHLDSIARGPGLNDNGTGVAALLETASQLGGSPSTRNAVRFAFWGAEESGVQGSSEYVRGLDADALDDIALYLNFDMLGSTNTGYFTYDGDGSARTAASTIDAPDGSAGIERTFAGYLNLAGVRPADMPLGISTDYDAFLKAGVPIGGTTTGSSQPKTEVQARLWGGRAGAAFDPNYHTARDNLDNVDARALSIMGPSVAYGVGTYAQTVEGVNGVPPRDQRHRRAP